MLIDADTAVVVCSGPSLDGLTPRAWADLSAAGAVVGLNGAPVSLACTRNAVRFTCIAAMDLAIGLAVRVPDLVRLWGQTPAWRVTSTDTPDVEAESYVHEVDEEHGVNGWSDDGGQGYKGGSTAMVIGNWLANAWPADAPPDVAGKVAPRRAFRKLAYVGLDMQPANGAHASGAGSDLSGFARSSEQYRRVCSGWERFCNEAAKRGVEVRNFTPGTGLAAMPRANVPASWVTG
jgi:hypothetical protein